jgi:hypothetical protein
MPSQPDDDVRRTRYLHRPKWNTSSIAWWGGSGIDIDPIWISSRFRDRPVPIHDNLAEIPLVREEVSPNPQEIMLVLLRQGEGGAELLHAVGPDVARAPPLKRRLEALFRLHAHIAPADILGAKHVLPFGVSTRGITLLAGREIRHRHGAHIDGSTAGSGQHQDVDDKNQRKHASAPRSRFRRQISEPTTNCQFRQSAGSDLTATPPADGGDAIALDCRSAQHHVFLLCAGRCGLQPDTP